MHILKHENLQISVVATQALVDQLVWRAIVMPSSEATTIGSDEMLVSVQASQDAAEAVRAHCDLFKVGLLAETIDHELDGLIRVKILHILPVKTFLDEVDVEHIIQRGHQLLRLVVDG